MKNVIAVSLLCLSSVAALGADLPGRAPPVIYSPVSAEPASNWSGLYVGAQAGYGFGNATIPALSSLTDVQGSALSGKLKRSGPMGGVQAGYALQSGSIVYGVEADLGFGSIRGSLDATGVYETVAIAGRLTAKESVMGTVRGRVGYAFDNVLIYGTGGFAAAYQEVKAEARVNQAVVYSGSEAGWAPGWTLGLGGEYALSRNTSLKLEYLHARLNNKFAGVSFTNSLNLFRTGVNYRF
jgi:outer membrane immunogenic protein